MEKVNVIGEKLDIDELKNRNRKLVSINKANNVYLFSCSGVIKELYTIENDKITEVEFRFNQEAYGYSDVEYDSSVQDAVQDVIPEQYVYGITVEPEEGCKTSIYSYRGNSIEVRYLGEVLDDWIIVTVAWVRKK